MHEQKTYIVLVNWNGWRDTILCLESVLRLSHPNFVVVVCDNASSDQSMDHIKQWCAGQVPATAGNPALAALTTPPLPKPVPFLELERKAAETGDGDATQLVLVHTGANLGFAGGNNVGFRYALARGDADYVWALNNDTVVNPNALEALTEHMRQHPSMGLCGSTVRYMNSPNTVQSLGGGGFNTWLGTGHLIGSNLTLSADTTPSSEDIESKMDYVFGASIIASKRLLDSVGLMYEGYFLFFEELDWAVRSKASGFRLGYSPKSVVYHRAGAATGSAIESDFSVFFLFKSRLHFYRRFYPLRLVVCYPLLWIKVFKAVIKADYSRAGAIAAALLGISRFRPAVKQNDA